MVGQRREMGCVCVCVCVCLCVRLCAQSWSDVRGGRVAASRRGDASKLRSERKGRRVSQVNCLFVAAFSIIPSKARCPSFYSGPDALLR